MEDLQPPGQAPRNHKLAVTIGLLAAGAVIGGITASTLTASAAPSPSPSAGTTVTPNEATETHPEDRSPTSVRTDEKTLTGTDADKAKAAALAAVPGGTVYRVETDGDGAAYEAHMTKADGTEVTVKMDKSFKVTSTEAGHGRGGGHHGGGGGRPNDNDADDAAGATASPAPSA